MFDLRRAGQTSLRFWRRSHVPEVGGPLSQAIDFGQVADAAAGASSRSRPASNEAQTSAEEYAARNAALAQSDPRPPPPDISNDPSAEIISTHLKPGDLLIWNSFTYHSAPGNSLPRRRAAYNVTWVGDDVLFKDLPCLSVYRSSSCVHGQPINCDKFPMLRGKQ